jgi:hypothetical protein
MSDLDNFDYVEMIYKPVLNIFVEVSEIFNEHLFQPFEYDHLNGAIVKLYLHANTALHISQGIPFKIDNAEMLLVDNSSLEVLARSALETYAAFHHWFVDPQNNEDMRKFRLAYSVYRGLCIGNLIATQIPIEAQVNNLAEKLKLLLLIRNTSHYKYLQSTKYPKKPKEFDKKIEDGTFYEVGKEKMIAATGISAKTTNILYGYLSDHTHSGFISLRQVAQNQLYVSAIERPGVNLSYFLIALSLMIKALAEKFPEVQKILEANPIPAHAINSAVKSYGSLFEGNIN